MRLTTSFSTQATSNNRRALSFSPTNSNRTPTPSISHRGRSAGQSLQQGDCEGKSGTAADRGEGRMMSLLGDDGGA